MPGRSSQVAGRAPNLDYLAGEPVSEKDFRAMLKGARLAERTVHICLRGDLVADFEAVDAELAAAANKPATSLAGNGTGPLLERLDALEAEMRDNQYPFRLRALPRRKRPGDDRPSWEELAKQHPPREREDGTLEPLDAMAGVNRETFDEPFLRVVIVDPVMTDDEFAELLSSLSDRQYADLMNTAWDVNQGRVDIPFSRAASRIRQNSDGE